MKSIRRVLGLVWLAGGPIIFFFLLKTAIGNITAEGKADINKPIPWMIIITIFTPIVAGLMIFGWYAWKGEYDEERKS